MKTAAKAPNPRPSSSADQQEAIRKRAEEIYIRNGRIFGRDTENWTQAEKEIRRESADPRSLKAIVVNVRGTQYIGQYDPESSDGYVPGEFGLRASIPVRFDDNKMFVKRPNGKVLETIVVSKIG